MDDSQRGKIRNRRLASQQKDYSGLRYGKITPMDIDGVVEFSDRLFIFLEYKGVGAPLAYGQRLCMQRIIGAIRQTGREAVAIVAEHAEPAEEDVDCANAIVREYYMGEGWTKPNIAVTVKDMVDHFHGKLGSLLIFGASQ